MAGAVAAITRAVAAGLHPKRGHRVRARMVRRARAIPAKVRGLRYRLAEGGPSPDVDDLVLTDRIRSSIGPLEKRLDVPRIHVMSIGHVAVLHGSVGSLRDAETLERAIARVPGVREVQSNLHIGLGHGDTRPSDGKAKATSVAYRRLTKAAGEAGDLDALRAHVAVAVVLSALAEAMPRRARHRLLEGLPADVQAMTASIRHEPGVRGDMLGLIAHATGLDREVADRVLGAVLAVFARLVGPRPEIADALPPEARARWLASLPA